MRVRRRMLLGLTAAGLAAAILVAAGAVGLIRSAVRERFLERIGAETALLAEWVQRRDEGTDLHQFAAHAAAQLEARVSLISADGWVLADSSVVSARLSRLENHIERPEIRAAALRGAGESFRVSSTTNVEYFYSARLVEGDGPVRFVRLALPSSQVQQVHVHYSWLVAGVVGVTMLLLVGIGYAAVRRLSRPIERITHSVERYATGDHHDLLEIPHYAGEELERLAATVKRMQLALLEKIDELDQERALLASVIGGMREGLLLVGRDRRVRLVNDALRRILDLSFDPTGHLLEEVVRQPTVIESVDATLFKGEESEESIVRLPGSGRAFRLQVSPFRGSAQEGEPEALALFFDITRLELLERVRRDFVANVSHELRTPLTSIKAFVETLLDGGDEDPANARRFLEIVRRHADRMGELIEDITDLSLIETGAIHLECRPVDAHDVVREVVEQLRPLAASRQVALQVELPSRLPVTADRRRLEQMLRNLVENAIKFNKPEGRVTVRGQTGDEHTTISVEDTGIGIPADSLERVFQRFFQINRHRSREVGGTGLGLSIVKHLMRLHGGRVFAKSELGHGSTFTLEFPVSGPGANVGALASTG